jgi:hypothetical protein
MKKLVCTNIGNKLAQISPCCNDNFNLFVDKAGDVRAKCTKCGTLYTLDSLRK